MKTIEDIYNELRDLQKASKPYDRELNALILSFEKSMYTIMSELNVTDSLLKEDLLQEGRLAVCKAIASFEPNKEASFYTFAYLCIKNAMLDYLRKMSAKKNQILGNAISIENINEAEIEDPSFNIEKDFDDKERIEELQKQLSPIENKVLTLHCEGLSYEAIAKEILKKPKDVDNILQKIKRLAKSK